MSEEEIIADQNRVAVEVSKQLTPVYQKLDEHNRVGREERDKIKDEVQYMFKEIISKFEAQNFKLGSMLTQITSASVNITNIKDSISDIKKTTELQDIKINDNKEEIDKAHGSVLGLKIATMIIGLISTVFAIFEVIN